MKQFLPVLAFAACLLSALPSVSWGQDNETNDSSTSSTIDSRMLSTEGAMNIFSGPPTHYKKASELTKMAEPMPGLGTLYVDPAMVPMGPYLGYDKDNQLLNIVYFVPLKQLDDHKNFTNLGAAFAKLDIDHTDIIFNEGHAGMDEPHYQIIEWVVTSDEAEKRAK